MLFQMPIAVYQISGSIRADFQWECNAFQHLNHVRQGEIHGAGLRVGRVADTKMKARRTWHRVYAIVDSMPNAFFTAAVNKCDLNPLAAPVEADGIRQTTAFGQSACGNALKAPCCALQNRRGPLHQGPCVSLSQKTFVLWYWATLKTKKRFCWAL